MVTRDKGAACFETQARKLILALVVREYFVVEKKSTATDQGGRIRRRGNESDHRHGRDGGSLHSVACDAHGDRGALPYRLQPFPGANPTAFRLGSH
jgi:hypothetical protein